MFFSTLLAILFYSHLSFAVERPFIISGFDDVLRQADNTGLLKSAIKILERDEAFTGMSELYTVISKEETDSNFVIVSAISTWFDGRISKFLKTSNFPNHRRYLRNWLTQWSIEEFKINRIHEILISRPTRKFIVIFDNSVASVRMANTIQAQFSDKIQAVYLHQIINKEMPQSATPYFTAFDIALSEYAKNRMSVSDLIYVGESILKEKTVQNLFPDYAVCPQQYNPCKAIENDAEIICNKVRMHIDLLCHHRGK